MTSNNENSSYLILENCFKHNSEPEIGSLIRVSSVIKGKTILNFGSDVGPIGKSYFIDNNSIITYIGKEKIDYLPGNPFYYRFIAGTLIVVSFDPGYPSSQRSHNWQLITLDPD